jgi:archaellum component FlaC
MNRSTAAKSVCAVVFVVLAAANMFCLTIAVGPAFAESAEATNGLLASTPASSHHKQSDSSKQPDLNEEMRKELNLPDVPTVHGFHPIKQTMGEMREIESINMRLYEEMKKLQLPVAGLQPTMLQLQNTMVHVDKQMDITHKQLGSVGEQMDAMYKQMGNVGGQMEAMQKQMGPIGDKMGAVQSQIGSVGQKMDSMHAQLLSVGHQMEGMHGPLEGVEGQVKQMEAGMSGLREDLKSIRSDLTAVRNQVVELQRPISQIRDPLLEVAGPLEGLGKRLDRLQQLVSYVLMSIIIATVGIAIGTPIAAFLIYKRFRGAFFSQALPAGKDPSSNN